MGEPGFFSVKSFVACCLAAFATAAAARAEPTSAPARASFPIFGISFDPPPGWIINPNPTLPNAAMYRLFDQNDHIIGELDVQVNETPPFERHKLDEFALAQNAEVLVQSFAVDGAAAVAVRKTQHDDKSEAFLFLVADHENRSYTFSVHGQGDNLRTHELITLIKSVHWIPVEDPLQHIDATQSVNVFSSANGTIQLPQIFRQIPSKQKDFAGFVVTDGTSKHFAAISFFFVPATDDHPGIPNDTQMIELRRNLLATAQQRWGRDDFPLMDTKNPLPGGVVTVPTPVSSLSPDAHVITTLSRYGAVFDKKGVTYIEMQSFGDPNETTMKWDSTLIDIANSLKFGDQNATQPATAK